MELNPSSYNRNINKFLPHCLAGVSVGQSMHSTVMLLLIGYLVLQHTVV